MSIGLTQVQANCLKFIENWNDERGIMPSYEEISEGLGLASKSAVKRTLDRLEERGAIRRLPKLARAIEIVPEPERRTVLISQDVWALLIGYCAAEQVTVETAVAQFVRDGIEGA